VIEAAYPLGRVERRYGVGGYRICLTAITRDSAPFPERGVRSGQAGLGGLQVTEQAGQRTLFRTAQITHIPNISRYCLFV
jgi:hypothetical protein